MRPNTDFSTLKVSTVKSLLSLPQAPDKDLWCAGGAGTWHSAPDTTPGGYKNMKGSSSEPATSSSLRLCTGFSGTMDSPGSPEQLWVLLGGAEPLTLQHCWWWFQVQPLGSFPRANSLHQEDTELATPSSGDKKQQEAPSQQPWVNTSDYCQSDPSWSISNVAGLATWVVNRKGRPPGLSHKLLAARLLEQVAL